MFKKIASKIRKQTTSKQSSKLLEFIGNPKPFNEKDLPTLRDVIKQALFLQEQSFIGNYE